LITYVAVSGRESGGFDPDGTLTIFEMSETAFVSLALLNGKDRSDDPKQWTANLESCDASSCDRRTAT